ncbi:MAG: peptidoglycan recognition family protein [Bryobacteraceae bacterium]
MTVQVTPSSPGEAHLVEWRARRIEDPVERLRYLRRSTSGDSSRGTAGAAKRRLHIFHKYLRGVAPSLLYVLVLLPAPTPSSTMDTERWEQAVQSPFGNPAREVYPAIWQVEKTGGYEVYSNGLRIEDQYATSNRPRALYPVFGRMPVEDPTFAWRSGVAGIVFHTTESHMLPFQAEQNQDLQRLGKNLLAVVRQNRSYHFVIDRFGRVFRVVQESDAANHAGESVWADATGTYVNLNDSFLGVAVEAETERGTDPQPSASPAQIHALRVLTEMLRSKYRIPASNCVTHAQVSVNPDNMRIGYHTDWAGNFPFAAVGLQDNYAMPPASLYAFGFEYDPAFVKSTGARVWKGLLLAEEQMREQAAARGMTVAKYRIALQQRFRQIHAALRNGNPEEKQS